MTDFNWKPNQPITKNVNLRMILSYAKKAQRRIEKEEKHQRELVAEQNRKQGLALQEMVKPKRPKTIVAYNEGQFDIEARIAKNYGDQMEEFDWDEHIKQILLG
mmetsp:Transcript_26013/g.39826  ORF Transcript_26013/g.39826 Transcript_26013/m.39826 type:complete len:104 (+) Transcript_26013:318-629(+)